MKNFCLAIDVLGIALQIFDILKMMKYLEVA